MFQFNALKENFFDTAKVEGMVDAGTRRALSKIGAYVRTRARSSLRRRKRKSAAGEPPSVHSTDRFATLKNILFAYDPERQSVVVGPVALRSRYYAVPPPALHEFGGDTTIREYQLSGGLWVRFKPKRGGARPTRTVAAHYPERAFMGPALQTERAKFSDAFKGSLGG